MAYIEYFPEEFIELNKEIINHPALMTLLQNHPQQEFEILLAQICHYCNIAIDGTFDEKELRGIADTCTQRLRARRGELILARSAPASSVVQDIILPASSTRH